METSSLLSGTIESIAYRGAGILRPAEGPVVFVQGGVCKGERVTARITRTHSRFCEAEVVSVETPSADRIEPVCRLADGTRVPGCVYDHLKYPAEVATKREQLAGFLRQAFRKAGREELDVESLLISATPSPEPLHYRNKIVLHASSYRGMRALGYTGDDNRTVIDIPQCPLAKPEINQELAALREDRAFVRAVRSGDDVTLRYTAANGVVAWINRPMPNEKPLTEHAFFGDLEVPLDGFYQVNPAVADLLASCLADEAVSHPTQGVVDAYCGIGILGFAVLSRYTGEKPRLLGMETGRAAVASARRNARRLGFSTAEYACCPVAEGLDAALKELGAENSFVILDPPRDGLEPEVLQTLLENRPPRLAYVSCSPDKLGRDLERLCAKEGGGYTPESVRLFDMFPRTHHFETLVLLKQ